MRLRYAGVCRVCGVELPARGEAIYERTTKTVRCVDHEVSLQVDAELAEAGKTESAGVAESVVVEVAEPAVPDAGEPLDAAVIDSGTPGASAPTKSSSGAR